MTPQQKQDVLADFQQWSGGFQPCECDDVALADYAYASSPADLTRDKVLEFLRVLQADPSAIGDD